VLIAEAEHHRCHAAGDVVVDAFPEQGTAGIEVDQAVIDVVGRTWKRQRFDLSNRNEIGFHDLPHLSEANHLPPGMGVIHKAAQGRRTAARGCRGLEQR
jgi:hypothetical protein